MRKIPAISELLSAIIIIASMAVAAGILYGIFAERASDTTDNISSNIDRSMQKAKELLSTSIPACNTGNDKLQFIIHNYSDDTNLEISRIRFYEIDGGSVGSEITAKEWYYFGEDTHVTDGPFYNRTSMQVGVSLSGCSDKELLIVTPAGEFVTIQP